MKKSNAVSLLCAVVFHSLSYGAVIQSEVTQTLWDGGVDGYNTYRIPAIVTTTNGTLLAFCEGRVNGSGDSGDIDLVMKRSVDGGSTWSTNTVIWSDGANTCGNPVPVVDQTSGRIGLLMTWNDGADNHGTISAGTGNDTRRVYLCHSTDDGLTWSAPSEITANVKDPSWGWYATGPGGGIQLTKGAYAGRMVVGCDHTDAGVFKSHSIYSDDGGSTWALGGVVPGTGLNESQVVEFSDGDVMINMRNYTRPPNARRVATSTDAAGSWSNAVYDLTLIEPICEGSIELVRPVQGNFNGMIAFLNPADENTRSNLTLRLSFDDAATWTESYVLEPGKSAYSDMAVTADGVLAALYEGGDASAYEEIRFARITLDETAILQEGLSPVPENVVFEGGMQAWFNVSDLDSIDNPVHAGRFSSWTSRGVAGVTVKSASDGTRPYYVANGFTRADGSDAPMVRFNREVDGTLIGSAPHYMHSESNNVTFNISQQSTWFVSSRLTYDNNQRSFFGLNISDGNRWGGFFLGAPNPPNRLRPHNSSSTGDVNMDLPKDEEFVLDSRRSASGVDTTFNGTAAKHSANGLGTMPSGGAEFRIAGMLDGVSAHAIFDLGEILVYNRAVNDAERVIIHNAMASRSGVALSGMDVYAGGNGPLNGFYKGVTGIGNYTAAVYPVAGAVTVSPSSGGLVVEEQNSTLNNSGEFVALGYKGDQNGWLYDSSSNRRLYREWYVQKTSSDGIDLKLTFDLSDGGVLSEDGLSYRLLYRSGCDGSFTSLSTSATVTGDQISFTLSNTSFESGCYTLGAGGVWVDESTAPLMNNSLVAIFRADQGVLVADPAVQNVAAWQSAYGQDIEVAALTDIAQPTLIAEGFERATGIYEPAVRFNWTGSAAVPGTPQVLQSAQETALGLKSNNTWFAVGRTLTANRNRGLFGLDNSLSRFGAFFLGSDVGSSASRVRTHPFIPWLVSSTKPEANITVNNSFLLDIRRRDNADDSAEVAAYLDGSPMTSASWPAADLADPVPSTFLIGNQLPGSAVDNLIGDVAEIRIYDRALNDAEKVIIQNHLAARYGLSLSANDLYAGDSGSAGDFDLDVVGVGCETASSSGSNPGTVVVSDSSGGLTLTGLNNTLNQGGEYLFAGHKIQSVTGDGWTNAVAGDSFDKRWQREWYINQHIVDGVDLRITFGFTSAGVTVPAGQNFVLLYRKGLTYDYQAVVVNSMVINGSTVSFELLNGKFVNGYYTLGIGDASSTVNRDIAAANAGVTSGLRAWFRASDSLGVNGSSVTNWGNLGLIGSDLDLYSAGGDPVVNLQGVERATGFYEPSVVFDGSGRLVSTLTSDLNVDRNLIWFVVLKPTGTMANKGLFGADDDDNRFGGFFTGGEGNPLRCHAYNSNNASYQRHLTVAPGSWQLADYQRTYSGSGYYLSASLNGFEADSTHAASQMAPGDFRFKIGDMLSDGSAITDFIGEIAELRVYSRALMDVERIIVQNHLAARYGITLADNNVYAGGSSANGECDIAVVGIGSVTGTAAYVTGEILESESSSGLRLMAAADSLDGGEFVLAGNGGFQNYWKLLGGSSAATRCWNREWYVDKTAVDGVDAELLFNFTDAGVSLYGPEAEPVYLLLYRADASAAYQDTGVTGLLDGDTLSFALDDTALVDGLYTVGVLLPPSGTLILVR